MHARRPGSGWVIGHAAGAPVVLAPGMLVAMGVLAVVVAPPAGASPELGTVGRLLVGLAVAILLLASVLLHELAHAVVSRRLGIRVRRIALALTGGHTESDDADTPRASALVAVVGPLANLAVAGAAWWGWTALGDRSTLALLLLLLASASAVVGAFNLLPGLPMDGGWILEALVWRATGRRATGTRVAAWTGRVLAVSLPVWAIAVPLLRGGRASAVTVVWSALIGAALWWGASEALRRAAMTEHVAALVVGALARPALTLPLDASAQDVAAAGGPAADAEVLLVDPGGAPVAWVDPEALAAVPEAARAGTPARAVVVPLPPGSVVDALLSGRAALQALADASRRSRVLAVRGPDGRVTGVVHYADVMAALRGQRRAGS